MRESFCRGQLLELSADYVTIMIEEGTEHCGDPAVGSEGKVSEATSEGMSP